MARIKEVSRSNLVRRLPIGRLREKGRMGGGAARRSSSSRGGASPELAKIGRPGGHFERGLAWDDLRTTRDPPER